MANISRDTYDINKKYVRLILQQGVPWVDADFNEAQDIERNLRRIALKFTAGDGTPNNGFQIKENSILNGGTGDLNNKFLITPGYFFTDGWITWFSATQEYNTQADWLTWDGGGEPAPQHPFVANPTALSAPAMGTRLDRVILCLWENEIDGIEDPNIIDPTLLVEASRRIKMMAFVYVSSDPVPINNATHKYIQLATITRIAGQDSIADIDITDHRVDLRQRLARMDELVDEVEAARISAVYGAHASLDERIEKVDAEVNTARGTRANLDTRVTVSLETNGDLKLATQEAAVQKTVNTQTLNFDHGLDVVDAGGKTSKIDVNESELNAGLIPNVPAGNITSVTIQGAINELDTEKIARDGLQELTGNWDVGNYDVRMKQLTADVAGGTPPIVVFSGTKVDTLNVDQLDGYDAGNATGNIPVSNGTLCVNLNCDQVDGKHAGYLDGNIAINGGGLNTNLNSDKLDGYDAGNANGNVPISNGTLCTNLNAEKVGGSTYAQIIAEAEALALIL